ncbi:MAG: hypothetical protein LBH18_05125 [Spirochaetaceae bacterium]|nr:hypothetical protein [Spirochaetaceae bacterium]
MSFLDLCLLFVGIALTMDSAVIPKPAAKTPMFINFVTGSIPAVGNPIKLNADAACSLFAAGSPVIPVLREKRRSND